MSAEEIKRDPDLIKDAMRQARKQPRPPEISRRCWGDCQDILVELARHVPNIWPSQAPSKLTKKGTTLVERTGMPLRTVERNLARLEAAGLITRSVRVLPNRWNATEYGLPWWVPLPAKVAGSSTPNWRVPTRQTGTPIMSSSTKKEKKDAAEPNTNSLREFVSDPPAGRGGRNTQAEEEQPPNKKPGYCVGCGIWVTVGEGTYQENEDGRLRAVHHRCHGSEPGSRDPVDEENAIQARQVLERYRAGQAEIEAAEAAGLPTAEISERYGFYPR